MRRLWAKSRPVPSGRIPSSTREPSPARRSPSATSWTVPSPPTTTSSVAPSRTASAASSARWPGRFEISASPRRPASAARRAMSGQRRAVAPLSDAGLTRKTVRLMVVRDGDERELGHLIDRRAQVLVGDALELALDDDVADGEEASRLDLAQRAECEEERSLHLHREDAAVRPALVLPAVGVVEDVARGDSADPDFLVERLRVVDGAVDEVSVRRRRVRIADEQGDGRGVGVRGGVS